MRPNLLILATVVSSALIGTGIALTGTLRSTALQPTQSAPVAQAPVDLQPAPSPVPPTVTPIAQVMAPTQPAAEPLFPPPSPSPDPNLTSASPVSPLRAQLRRAIQERNLTMLKSLLQAGSLREALRDIEVQEQINLDNLDASAWKMLETAIDYRCRQAQTNDGQSACFNERN